MDKHFTELVSKMATLPFTEFLFVKEPVFEKLFEPSSKKYKEYSVIKKKIQQELVGKQHIRNLDTLNLLLEQYFPLQVFAKADSEDQVYMEHLSKLTDSFITHRNGRIALKYWKNKHDEILFSAFDGLQKIEVWHVLSRIFCVDILVVIYLLNNKMAKPEYLNGYYWLINLGDMQLDKIMERGLAENHIHISAGVNFNMIWHDLMNMNLDKSTLSLKPIWKIIDDPYIEESLRIGSIVRVLLFKYLIAGIGRDFEDYLESYVLQDTLKSDVTNELSQCLRWFIKREGPPPVCNYKKIYAFILRDLSLKDGANACASTEIIKVMSGFEELHTTDENIFLFKVMQYMKERMEYQRDVLLSRLFWQYLRIKNIVYQGITQGNFMEGLDYFRLFFSKATSTSPKHLKHAIRNQIYNNNLKKLEIRVSPSSSYKIKQIKQDLRKNLLVFFETYRSILEDNRLKYDNIPQIGIVYHFIKSQDETFYEKCWFMDSQRNSLRNENYFYGSLQRKYKETIDAINELRESIKGLSKYIVGIDAASLENNTEPWVFAPIFRHARDSTTSRIRLLDSGEPVQTLGFTYHVGEEFRHLLSGLRHVDEVIEHFNYRVADRIGHGIALGIDVRRWCMDNPVVVLPRIEYLENLLWLWGQAFMEKEYKLELDLLGLEREVMLQAEKIYHNIEGISLFMLWKAYQGKFNPFQTNERYINEMCVEETSRSGKWRNESPMPEQHFCKQSESGASTWNESKLLHANHCKCFLERMYEVIQVAIGENEVILFERMQIYIKNKLNHKGITVEANPTSNLAISGIDKLFKHPIIQLNKQGLEQKEHEGGGLVISINSDDPAVFNTSISNELAYIYYLLQDKGYPRDSILEWIEKIRDWGVMTSFIQDRIVSKQELIDEIEQIITSLK